MKQLTLGKVINKLQKLKQDLTLEVSIKGLQLDGTHESYRGYYEDVAFGFNNKEYPFRDSEMTVGKFLSYCKEMIDTTLCGWKGGEYTCEYNTLCWLANEGDCSQYKVMDIISYNNKAFMIVIHDGYHAK